jgi:uncharacterized repeat protein (TIGR03803 family)
MKKAWSFGTRLYIFSVLLRGGDRFACPNLHRPAHFSASTDGGHQAGSVQGTDGNFYRTTQYAGSDMCGTGSPDYCGTVFKITPPGILTTLYSFCKQAGCRDGRDPSGLVQGSDGNFYGTISSDALYSYGTVFKIIPSGRLTTLHVFNGTDGEVPGTGVIQGADGNFYGTT